jgi:hypothetical protein
VQLTHGLPTPMVATTLTPLGKSIEAWTHTAALALAWN